jgi:hypothetical protein
MNETISNGLKKYNALGYSLCVMAGSNTTNTRVGKAEVRGSFPGVPKRGVGVNSFPGVPKRNVV